MNKFALKESHVDRFKRERKSVILRKNTITTRTEIAYLYGGNNLTGISVHKSEKVIFLFHKPTHNVYCDKKQEDFILYDAQGTKGDHKWTSRNNAVKNSEKDNMKMYLFEKKGNNWINMGRVKLARINTLHGILDEKKTPRSIFQFVLKFCDDNEQEEPRRRIIRL